MDEILNDNLILEGSLCKTCKYRVSRVIKFLSVEDQEEALGILVEGEDVPVISVICKELNIDLDHVVLQCTMYNNTHGLLHGK